MIFFSSDMPVAGDLAKFGIQVFFALRAWVAPSEVKKLSGLKRLPRNS